MPILSMPTELTVENRDTIRLNGLVRTVAADGSTFVYEWTYLGNTTTIILDFGIREISLPDEISPELLDYFTSILGDWETPPDWETPASQLLDRARSAVGKSILDMTIDERWAVVALLLWDRKAFDLDLRLNPLRDWVRRHPDGA